MKHLKRIGCFVMALMLLCSLMAVPAFAADEKGSITINGITNDGKTVYEIYKLLDLESYDTTDGVYSYKVNAAWKNFFATDEAKVYFSIDENGYATWVTTEDADTVNAFAKKALAYATANGIAPVKSSKNTGDMTVVTVDEKSTAKFTGLELGYYLIDSTIGSLCGLTTTNPDASINAKNQRPTVDK